MSMFQRLKKFSMCKGGKGYAWDPNAVPSEKKQHKRRVRRVTRAVIREQLQ
jgi:hypothetical protein